MIDLDDHIARAHAPSTGPRPSSSALRRGAKNEVSK